MSRKTIRWILSLTLLTASLFMVYRIREKVKAKKLINEKIQYRPEKRFCTLDSADFYLPKQELVLIFFNSGCEHCQYEMKDVREKINLFKGRPIVFLSSENISVISSASRNFKLDSLPNVTFAKINPDDVFDAFGSVSIPHIFIYDQPGKLIKEFKGETKVEAIANSLP